MAEVESLAKARADKHHDCKLWSPEDMLVDLLEDVRAGKIKPSQMVVHFLEDTEEGRRRHSFAAAGVSYSDHIALLHIAMHRATEDWLS